MGTRLNLPPTSTASGIRAATASNTAKTKSISSISSSNQLPELNAQHKLFQPTNRYGYIPTPIMPTAPKATTPSIKFKPVAPLFSDPAATSKQPLSELGIAKPLNMPESFFDIEAQTLPPTTDLFADNASDDNESLSTLASGLGIQTHTPYTHGTYAQARLSSTAAPSVPTSVASEPYDMSHTMVDESYPVWLPPSEFADFYSQHQLDPSPFVYDPVIHSIFDNSVLLELVTSRTTQILKILTDSGVNIDFLGANRLAVAGIEGEYARILPFMVDAYIRNYETERNQFGASETIPDYLYYPMNQDTYPTGWVKPSYTKIHQPNARADSFQSRLQDDDVDPRLPSDLESSATGRWQPSAFENQMLDDEVAKAFDYQDSDFTSARNMPYARNVPWNEYHQNHTQPLSPFEQNRPVRGTSRTATDVELSGPVPAHYFQPYEAFEAQQYFLMPDFLLDSHTGKLILDENSAKLAKQQIGILAELGDIKTSKARTQRLLEIYEIESPQSVPPFWTDAIEMGFPPIKKEGNKWIPLGFMSQSRAKALSSLATLLERSTNSAQIKSILNIYRAGELAQRCPPRQPTFLQEAQRYFDLPNFGFAPEKKAWTPAADVNMSQRAELEILAAKLSRATPQERIRILSARKNGVDLDQYAPPPQPAHVKEWQALTKTGVPYFGQDENGAWLPIGTMNDEIFNELVATAADLEKLQNTHERIQYLTKNQYIEIDASEADLRLDEQRQRLFSNAEAETKRLWQAQPQYWRAIRESGVNVPLLEKTSTGEYVVPKLSSTTLRRKLVNLLTELQQAEEENRDGIEFLAIVRRYGFHPKSQGSAQERAESLKKASAGKATDWWNVVEKSLSNITDSAILAQHELEPTQQPSALPFSAKTASLQQLLEVLIRIPDDDDLKSQAAYIAWQANLAAANYDFTLENPAIVDLLNQINHVMQRGTNRITDNPEQNVKETQALLQNVIAAWQSAHPAKTAAPEKLQPTPQKQPSYLQQAQVSYNFPKFVLIDGTWQPPQHFSEEIRNALTQIAEILEEMENENSQNPAQAKAEQVAYIESVKRGVAQTMVTDPENPLTKYFAEIFFPEKAASIMSGKLVPTPFTQVSYTNSNQEDTNIPIAPPPPPPLPSQADSVEKANQKQPYPMQPAYLKQGLREVDILAIEQSKKYTISIPKMTQAPFAWSELMTFLEYRSDNVLMPNQDIPETKLLALDESTDDWKFVTEEAKRKYEPVLRELIGKQNHSEIRTIIRKFGMEPNREIPDGIKADPAALRRWKNDQINLARMGQNNFWWKEVQDYTREEYKQGSTPLTDPQAWPLEQVEVDGRLKNIRITYPGLRLTKASDDEYGLFVIPEGMKGIAKKLINAQSYDTRSAIITQHADAIKQAVKLDKSALFGSDLEQLSDEARVKRQHEKLSKYVNETLIPEENKKQTQLARMRFQQDLLHKKASFLRESRDIDQMEIDASIYASMRIHDLEQAGNVMQNTQREAKHKEFEQEWLSSAIARKSQNTELNVTESNDDATSVAKKTLKWIQPIQTGAEEESNIEDSISSIGSRSPIFSSTLSTSSDVNSIEEAGSITSAQSVSTQYTPVKFDEMSFGWQFGMTFADLPYIVLDPTDGETKILRPEHQLLEEVKTRLDTYSPNDEKDLTEAHYVAYIKILYAYGLLRVQDILDITDRCLEMNYFHNTPSAVFDMVILAQDPWWRFAMEYLDAPPMIEDNSGKLVVAPSNQNHAAWSELADKLKNAKNHQERIDIVKNSEYLRYKVDENGVKQDLILDVETPIDNSQLDDRPQPDLPRHVLFAQLKAEAQVP